jgi:hypothetical protein
MRIFLGHHTVVSFGRAELAGDFRKDCRERAELRRLVLAAVSGNPVD